MSTTFILIILGCNLLTCLVSIATLIIITDYFNKNRKD